MREIKFRGKRLDNGEWVYGHYIKVTPYKDVDGHRICTQDTWDMIPVDPASLGQFTGLRDKNGREIYEGDILHDFDWDCDGAVKWSSEHLSWMLVGDDSREFLQEFITDEKAMQANTSVVVATIHDAPKEGE